MFSVYITLLVFSFLGTLYRVKSLVELPNVEVDDLIRTEEILRNTTNSILSSLKLAKPRNNTRIEEFSKIHNYFLSVTLQDSNNLRRIARLTRVDYKKYNNSTENLTTIINELLDDVQCDSKVNNTNSSNEDWNVILYVDSFLAKLEKLKESYGVNKVFSDINSNIIKLFEDYNKSSLRSQELENTYNTFDDNYTLLDSNEFWEPSGRRIYKGKRTKIRYFPFMASIQIFNIFQCAGSIIKSDLVITASSCLQLAWNNRFFRENPAFLSVIVGSSFYNSGGENVPVLEIYFHPDYNPKTLWNNICLLRLLKHLKFNWSRVKKIAIDRNPWSLPTNTPGITIIGWGAKGMTNKMGDPLYSILAYSVLDVYPYKECQNNYNKEYVSMRNFCGGFFSKGAGACNHDVGAPGVIDGTLMGVVSFGSPVCGTPDAPTVFTKVGFYYRWIDSIMKMEVPKSNKKVAVKYTLDPHDRFLPPNFMDREVRAEDVPQGKKRVSTKFTLDPYDQFMTTTVATTPFKIGAILPGQKPPSVLDDTEYEGPLRTLDNKLFQDFLETMFGSNEVKKYDGAINKDTNPLREINISDKEDEYSMSTDEEFNSDRPYTVGYDSDEIPRTQLIPIDPVLENTNEIDEDVPITGNSVVAKELNDNNNDPAQENKPKILKKIQKNNYLKQLTTTTESAQEIYLELAPESSKDYEQSDAMEIMIPDDNLKDVSSVADVSGEQVISELLDEIDFSQILREVSTSATIVTSTFKNYETNVLRHRYFSSTPNILETKKYYNYNNNYPEYKSEKSKNKPDDSSELTLLYLTDTEKKRNSNSKIGKVDKVIQSKDNRPKDSMFIDYKKIYDLGKKSQLFKIISRVIEAAINSK